MTRNVLWRAIMAVGGMATLGIAGFVLWHLAGVNGRAVAEQSPSRTSAPRSTPSEQPARSSDAQAPGNGSRHSTRQPAHLEPYEQTEILAKASGFVSRVHVDIGDLVEKDQVLAELWIPEMDEERLLRAAAVEVAAANRTVHEAQVAEAEAAMERVQARYDLWSSQFSRLTDLASSGSVSRKLADETEHEFRASKAARTETQAKIRSAHANLKHVQARLKMAEAELKKTEVLMGYALVRAPYAGRITRRRIDTGDFVTSSAGNTSEPLFTLGMVDSLRIVVDVPESQASLVAVGQPAELVIDATKGNSYRATVKRTAGVLDPRTRTLRVEAELNKPAPELLPGMYGALTISLAENTK